MREESGCCDGIWWQGKSQRGMEGGGCRKAFSGTYICAFLQVEILEPAISTVRCVLFSAIHSCVPAAFLPPLPAPPPPTMSFRPSTQRTMAAVITASALGGVAYAWAAKGGGLRSPSSLLSRSFGKRCDCVAWFCLPTVGKLILDSLCDALRNGSCRSMTIHKSA